MIRALFLSPESPFPMIGGGALRSASVLQFLTERLGAEVHAIVFREQGSADPALAMPRGRVAKLDVVTLPHHSKSRARRVVRNALRFARNRPPLIDRFSGFESQIAQAIVGRSYDVAILEHFWCAPYVRQIRPHARSVILDLHNIESAWHRSLAAHESWLHGIALRRFERAASELERLLLPQFDSILATSDADRARLEGIRPGLPVTVYPNALPPISAPPRAEQERIVFSGNLEYPPNIEAVRFFHRFVWPELRQRPGLSWMILGKNPDPVKHIVAGDPRIEITGFVEDAIGSLATAQVAVVPLLSGSGTRIKILEAWAAGTPVVSTSLGAEGLSARHGEHLLLADDAAALVRAVAGLLDSPSERQRIGLAGRRLFWQCYTWPNVWQSLLPAFRNVADGDLKL